MRHEAYLIRVPELQDPVAVYDGNGAVCSHGYPDTAPCGGGWCLEHAGHASPHTGQETRCDCGDTYEKARARYLASGSDTDLAAMLRRVR